MKGTIKRFYYQKGFGFIEGESGTEYFFHYTDYAGEKRDLRPGKVVRFEAQQGDKGPCAASVSPEGASGAQSPKPAATRPAKPVSGAGLFVAGLVLGLMLGAGAVALYLNAP